MKQLVIISGKGGTGKTSVAASLIHLASQTHRVVAADADVDAANLALVLSPTEGQTTSFTGGKVAVINPQSCTLCGICHEVCRFDAVQPGVVFTIDPVACEGCAACHYQCPSSAITMDVQTAGEWTISKTRFGPLYYAHLYAGQENSGKLVTLIKSKALQYARDSNSDFLLVDSPPGIGCPVIASIAGADLVLIVTEPSVAGVHDMERILGLTGHFHIPASVMINKADLSQSRTASIIKACDQRDVPVMGCLPYDITAVDAAVRGLPVTEFDSELSVALRSSWVNLQNFITQM
ncbi:MAG: ATP-binding protein [Anaerolineae bacterium]|nr:ATP-binding protein [Anaerolineae bacterium]